MLYLGLVSLFLAVLRGIDNLNADQPRSEFVPPPQPRYKHPSFKPTRSDWQPQPKPSTKAYRGPTAVRIKPNRHQRKRNKA